MPRAGLNGNYHSEAVFDPEGALKALGVTYLGNGDWELPADADIDAVGPDDWVLMLPDGTTYYIWTED